MTECNIETVDTMDEILPMLGELLSLGKSVRIYPRGVSMLPMLRQGVDSVILSPVSGKLKKYDIALYRRDTGKCFLHRVVDAGTTYVCIGDNQFKAEPGIRQDQVLAVVTAFYRGEKQYALTAPIYRLYCRVWHASRALRHFWRRGCGWIRRRLK